MKKNHFFKQFVLMGILLFSSYLGFAQSQQGAIFTITTSQDLAMYEAVIEIEYRRIDENGNEGDWILAAHIIPNPEPNRDGLFYTTYELPNLERGGVYEVRVRAYITNGDYQENENLWSTMRIEIPFEGSYGYWDIYCRPINLPFALNVIESNDKEVLVSKEGETTKEAIKEK